MSADSLSDGDVRDLLRSARSFAIVGASNKEGRPSYGVMAFLIARGYEVFPVNPGLANQDILGRKVFATLAAVPAPIDVVDIFRNSDAAAQAVDEALAEQDRLQLKAIWMQLGVVNLSAAAAAEAAGLTVVMDRCPKIEAARLL